LIDAAHEFPFQLLSQEVENKTQPTSTVESSVENERLQLNKKTPHTRIKEKLLILKKQEKVKRTNNI